MGHKTVFLLHEQAKKIIEEINYILNNSDHEILQITYYVNNKNKKMGIGLTKFRQIKKLAENSNMGKIIISENKLDELTENLRRHKEDIQKEKNKLEVARSSTSEINEKNLKIAINDICPQKCKKLLKFLKEIYASVTIPDPFRGFYDIDDDYIKSTIIELSHFQNEFVDHEDLLVKINEFMALISKCEEGMPKDIKVLLLKTRNEIIYLINHKLEGMTNSSI